MPRPAWMSVVLVIALGVGATGCGSEPSPDRSSATTVATGAQADATPPSRLLDPAAFQQYLTAHPEAPLINVHVPYEGNLAGTDNYVAFDEIGSWDGLPSDKDAPLALYCRSGNMSATASETLRDMGYTNLVELDGGMEAWQAAGYQLEDDDPAGR